MIADSSQLPCTVAVSGDERMQNLVESSLRSALGNRSQVAVEVTDGTATLRGSLNRYYHKQLAQETVKRIEGIRSVRNEIRVVSQ